MALSPTGSSFANNFKAAIDAQCVFMDKYGEPLENLLQIAVYLIPTGDDEDDEGFWNQVVYSVTDLFNLYRTVLLRSWDALPVEAPDGQLTRLRRTYTMSAFTLRSLRAVQVLFEMRALRNSGAGHALRVCIRIEVVKLVLKCVLRSTMPFSFYIDEEALEEVEPPKGKRRGFGQSSAPALQDTPATLSNSSSREVEFVGSRSGRRLRALEAAVTSSSLRSDRSLGTVRTAVGEVLFHGRPLAHLLLMARRGQKSWLAWWFAFVVDRLSLGLLVTDLQPREGTRAGSLELAEIRRRQAISWWALARSPFFDKFFSRLANALNDIMKRIPVLNIFNIVEIMLALRPYYFTTSGT